MKFLCTKNNLLTGLSHVVPLAGRNKQLPQLSHVLLKVGDGVMEVSCTDLEMGVGSRVTGKVEEAGECTVPARQLLDYVQQLPGSNPIEIRRTDAGVLLRTDDFKAVFPVAASDDFPEMPEMKARREFTVDVQGVVVGLSQVMFSAARDDTRPELKSVYVAASKGELRLAATDSFRLAEARLDVKESGEWEVLLPVSAAGELVRLLGDIDKKEVKVSLYDGHIGVESGPVVFLSRLVDGRYPDYLQIIPSEFTVSGKVDVRELVRGLKSLQVLLPRDSRRVRVVADSDEGELVASVASGGEEGEVTLKFTGEEAGRVESIFNVNYLLEGLQRIAQDVAWLGMAGAHEPAVLKPLKGEVFKYIVMPIEE